MTLPDIAPALLGWYDKSKRALPFREHPTPYRVWVSEIMLQQTRVNAALPYYERFIAALPTVADLAACKPERLDKLWEGLGYYSRARSLQKAARIVMEQYGGKLPADYNTLQKLPGIGAYTAGAIASICFGQRVPAVDGNVLRVFSRLLNDARDITLPDVKKDMTRCVLALQPPERPGDYNQALMELGALVCVPGGAPLCGGCPLSALCAGRAAGTQSALPAKPPKAPKKKVPYTTAIVFTGEGPGRRVLLEKRGAKGLLAGLWQPILLEGRLTAEEARRALAARGITVEIRRSLPDARHVFTHLIWEMRGYLCAALSTETPTGCVWADPDSVESIYTVPSAFAAYRAFLCDPQAFPAGETKKNQSISKKPL